MKKIFLIIMALLALPAYNYAQVHKTKIANKDTKNWRFEVECAGIGEPGTSLVKVWTYSRSKRVAINQAKKNAVYAIVFRGYSGKAEGCHTQPPLDNDPIMNSKTKAFFDNFFSDTGDYLKFASLSGDGRIGPGDIMRVGKRREYKIGVVVTVMTSRLRKYLESAGVIKPLSSGF